MDLLSAIMQAVPPVGSGSPWEGLLVSGPLASVLGVAVYTLWTALQVERAAHKATLDEQAVFLKSLVSALRRESDHDRSNPSPPA